MSLVLYIGEKTFGVFNASQLDIGYLDFELEGKDVPLLTKPVEPPTSRVQRYMLVDPNNPSIFGLYGVWMKNVGHSQIETLNMSIHLNMSAEVTQPPAVLSCWRPFPSSEVGYVAEFRCAVGAVSMSPGQRWDIPWFVGTPVPTQAMKVKLRAFYGKTAEATFTIQPPIVR